ncbi:MAG: DMT family transporter [Celeribacter sp.]|jgi:drug/metabolite transporter (DMT)-like permease
MTDQSEAPRTSTPSEATDRRDRAAPGTGTPAAAPPVTASGPGAAQSAGSPLAGVLWMVATGFCMVGVTATVKYVGGRIPAAESAFLRYAIGSVFFLPILPKLLRTPVTGQLARLYGFRAAVHTLGVMSWFYAMARITMAEVTALNYLSPVLVTIGAVLFFGERMAVRRILAIGVALVGTLIILRPGMRELEPGHFAMLATASLFACSYLTAKRLTALAEPVVVVAILSITVAIGLAPFAWLHWIPPTGEEVFWLLICAGFASAGHLFMTFAFRAAPMAVTQPITFLQLILSVVLGAALFGEAVDIWVVIGGGLVLGAISFITWREAVLNRRITPASPALKG